MTHPGSTEHGEQATVIAWANLHTGRWPALRWLHAVPNWRVKKEHRIYMAEEGVKKGVADLCLPTARGGYFGLYVEMKRDKKSVATSEQIEFLEFVAAEGYQGKICHGADEAIAVLEEYLAMPRTAHPALVDELDAD